MEALVALLTLTALEIVLGIDNIVFISILTDKLPPEQRAKARFVGLSLAFLMRWCSCFRLLGLCAWNRRSWPCWATSFRGAI